MCVRLDRDGRVYRDPWSVLSAPGTRLVLRQPLECAVTVKGGQLLRFGAGAGERELVVSTPFGDLNLPFASKPHWPVGGLTGATAGGRAGGGGGGRARS